MGKYGVLCTRNFARTQKYICTWTVALSMFGAFRFALPASGGTGGRYLLEFSCSDWGGRAGVLGDAQIPAAVAASDSGPLIYQKQYRCLDSYIDTEVLR